MRIGLVYEDEAIRTIFEILAPKILGEPVELESRLGRSWPGVLGQLVGLLQTLSVVHLWSPLDCVMVVVDANSEEPHLREQRLLRKVGNRQFRFGVPKYHAIKHQVEAWLLADSEALNAAAGTRIPPVPGPEALPDPKRHLIQVLKNRNGSPYDMQFACTAAEAASVDTIAERCAGFREFIRKLRECRRVPHP